MDKSDSAKASKRESDRRYREKHRARILAQKKEYAANNSEAAKRKAHEWYKANRERARVSSKEWRERNKETVRETIREYQRRNPHKRRAYKLVRKALAEGVMTKGACEICQSEKVEAHHDDYDQPLKVRWLCRIHHREQHRKYDYGDK